MKSAKINFEANVLFSPLKTSKHLAKYHLKPCNFQVFHIPGCLEPPHAECSSAPKPVILK